MNKAENKKVLASYDSSHSLPIREFRKTAINNLRKELQEHCAMFGTNTQRTEQEATAMLKRFVREYEVGVLNPLLTELEKKHREGLAILLDQGIEEDPILDSEINYGEMRILAREQGATTHGINIFEYLFSLNDIHTYRDMIYFFERKGTCMNDGVRGLHQYKKIGPKASQLLYAHLASKGVNLFEDGFNDKELPK